MELIGSMPVEIFFDGIPGIWSLINEVGDTELRDIYDAIINRIKDASFSQGPFDFAVVDVEFDSDIGHLECPGDVTVMAVIKEEVPDDFFDPGDKYDYAAWQFMLCFLRLFMGSPEGESFIWEGGLAMFLGAKTADLYVGLGG